MEKKCFENYEIPIKCKRKYSKVCERVNTNYYLLNNRLTGKKLVSCNQNSLIYPIS